MTNTTMQHLTNKIYSITGFRNDKFNSFKNPIFILFAFLVLCVIVAAYSNHFANSFNFDDTVTIVNNAAIKEVNISRFITDGTTSSSLPSNQTYRPYLTTSFAIDYKLGGGLNPTIFHIHSFVVFLLVCILLCIAVKKILDKISFSNYNQFWGLLAATIFGMLCANAETVNYISQRAEILVGLFLLAGFVAFLQGGWWRSKYVYLLFPFIGFFSKENALVFAPLLLLYVLIFEENVNLLHFYKAIELRKISNSFLKVLPAIVLTVAFYIFYSKMRSESFILGGGPSVFKYLITQPMVLCHYILTFIVPYNLSADTDWTIYSSIFDYRAILGILLVVGLIFIALKASKNKETRLFSFGILWFFIAHLPTSSIIPFTEVLNDHRSFVPYLGLTIAMIFGVKYLLQKYLSMPSSQNYVKVFVVVVMIIFLGANVYGIRERNKVWKDGMSLWYDVTQKSPKNGRGLMNYGLMLLNKGDYAKAEVYFNKALEFTPDYANLWINLGLLKTATGDNINAEKYFVKAISCPIFKHLGWYYYGRFLYDQGRYEEAKESLNNALKLVPEYRDAQNALMLLCHQTNDWAKLKELAHIILKTSPADLLAKKYLEYAETQKSVIQLMEEDALNNPTAEKYLNLSMKYFQLKEFEKCISSAQHAIALKSDYAEAYNNMGVAFRNLKEYDKAIEAFNKAVGINPDFILAKNNLSEAKLSKNMGNNSAQLSPSSANDYLNLSVMYYNVGDYIKCIEAAKKSISIVPSSNAYSNMCAAYSQLKQYNKAIQAGNEALKLDANNVQAKSNLKFALEHNKK